MINYRAVIFLKVDHNGILHSLSREHLWYSLINEPLVILELPIQTQKRPQRRTFLSEREIKLLWCFTFDICRSNKERVKRGGSTGNRARRSGTGGEEEMRAKRGGD